MTRSLQNGGVAFGIAALVVVLDQTAKAWVVSAARVTGGSPSLLFGPIRLNLSFNNGVSFGFLRSDAPYAPWLFAAFALLVTGMLARWALNAPRLRTVVAIGFVMGGAVGNLVDRIVRKAVVDFIDASALDFPWVFNLADSAITVGVVLLLAENLFSLAKPA